MVTCSLSHIWHRLRKMNDLCHFYAFSPCSEKTEQFTSHSDLGYLLVSRRHEWNTSNDKSRVRFPLQIVALVEHYMWSGVITMSDRLRQIGGTLKCSQKTVLDFKQDFGREECWSLHNRGLEVHVMASGLICYGIKSISPVSCNMNGMYVASTRTYANALS